MLKNVSFRTKIIGFNLITVLTIAIAGGTLFHLTTKQSKDKLGKSFLAYAQQLQASVSAQFFERYGDVQAFATNSDIKSFDSPKMLNAVNNYVTLYGIYDLIMVIDTKGNLVVVNDHSPSGKKLNVSELYKKNYSNEPWFQNTLNGKFTSDTSKGYDNVYFQQPNSDPFVEEAYGEKRWGNSFSAQVKNGTGEVIGVISNRANFAWVENEVLNAALPAKSTTGVDIELMVINKDGIVLAIHDTSENAEVYTRKMDEVGHLNILNEHPEISGFKYTETRFAEALDHEINRVQLVAQSSFTDKKWIANIGWATMIHIDDANAYAHLYAAERNFIIQITLAALIFGFLSFLFGNSIAKYFSKLTNSLGTETEKLLQNSVSMATTSEELSSAATQQAAALQETVSAIDQVNAMVSKNAENALKSKEISQGSEKSAHLGKQSMEEMIKVIDQIHSSNSEMMAQIQKSNEEFTKIVAVINEIGSKTKVINDIVFQTKLLSFNASVEAARAGVHGKGFSVVAEEVGNLAQMSGNAAKEISTLLDSSITTVESIVKETKSRVDVLVVTGKDKVDLGIQTAKNCGFVLEEIVTSVSQVNQMVEEISTASAEQAQGVTEITKAMNQLDQVTQQNTRAANVSSNIAADVKTKSEHFEGMVHDLSAFIFGKPKAAPLKPQNSPTNTTKFKPKSLKKAA